MTNKELARNKSYRAIKKGILIPAKICSMCSKEKLTEGHHPDYNKPLEVIWLCRSCHMITDGRMKNSHIKKEHPLKKCNNCKRLVKPLRKGLCHSCNEYLRRNGRNRPWKNDGRKEKSKITHNLPCLRCGRKASIVGNPVKGYCTSCYTFLWRNQRCHNILDMPHRIDNRRGGHQGIGGGTVPAS